MFASGGWAAAEAIGTIAAAVVALGIALAPAVHRRWTRPKLSCRLGDEEPHVIVLRSDDQRSLSLVDDVAVRVEVYNKGGRAAREVWCRVTNRWKLDLPPEPLPFDPPGFKPAYDPDWRLVDSEPLLLHWSSQPPALERQSASRLDIAAGQAEFVEVAVLDSNRSVLSVAADDLRACRTNPSDSQPVGRHRWELTVGADEVEPITRVVEFLVDGKNFISRVGHTQPPADAKDVRLLRLLRDLGSDD